MIRCIGHALLGNLSDETILSQRSSIVNANLSPKVAAAL